MNRNKIVVTIGPKSANEKTLQLLLKKGMDVARLNGSHNNLEWHRKTIQMIHNALPGIPILIDIPGRKIRTGDLEKDIEFSNGNILIFSTEKSPNLNEIPLNYNLLHKDLKINDIFFVEDGMYQFKVVKLKGSKIFSRALNSGKIRSRKGVNVPKIKINKPFFAKNEQNFVRFCINNKIDFIGISFVESVKEIKIIKKFINRDFPKVVSKVENQNAMDNLDEIVKNSDVIMIDRGDLSTETNQYELFKNQQEIIKICNKYSTPVIVATEMLNSMIKSKFPTKAEICDISNAVISGASATMLSGETAIGRYPIESVETMRKVSDSVERETSLIKRNKNKIKSDIPSSIAEALENIVEKVGVTKIICVTKSGYSAKILSTKGFGIPIICVTDNEISYKSFKLYKGVKVIKIKKIFPKESADHILDIIVNLVKTKELNKNDLVAVVGVLFPKKGKMNSLQLHDVRNFIN